MEHRVPFLALAILFAAFAADAADVRHRVEATVTLPHDTILPGVPFDAVISVKNVWEAPVSVGLISRIIVTLPDGTRLQTQMKLDHRLGHQWDNEPAYEELQPGETKHWGIPWRTAWRHLEGYSAPGTYGIAFELAGSYGESPYDYIGPVTTNTVRLHRQLTSSEEDAAIWSEMLRRSGGHVADDWFDDSAEGRSLLERILKEHPNSAYYPYAVALAPEALRRPATEADITRTSDAASRSKDSPAYPYLVATAGAYAEELAVAASAKRDVRAAAKYYAIAAKYAAAIAASTENPALLQDADLAKSRIEHDRTQLENAVSIPVQRPRR